jgi:type II secretory pathway predicted ATPase ExeA
MSVDTLEELRMLSNVNADKDQVLGRPRRGRRSCAIRYAGRTCEQFAQKNCGRLPPRPLNREETRTYIRTG